MSARSFFSEEDSREAKRWEPGSFEKRAAKSEPAVPPSQVSDVRSRARDEGYRAGFAAGSAEVAALKAKFLQMLETGKKSLAETEQAIADNLLDLSLDVARQIVRADIRVRREHVLMVIREAMDCLPQSTPNPKLFLHPNDVDLVKAHIGDEISIGAWRIVEDHRVEPGGCRISSPNCEIDATLATRWKRVIGGLGRDASWVENEAQS